MAGLDDLLQGLKAFDEGMTQFAVGRAINGAKDQMDQLNQSAMNEMERRAELEKISKGLTLQLGGLGAPVSQIQSAVGAVAPKALGTPGAALWEGIQTGSKDLQSLGQQGIAAEEQVTNRREDRAFGRDMEKLKFQRETALMEARLKGQGREKLKELSDKNLDALSKSEELEALVNEIQADIDKNPALVGPTRGARSFLPGSGLSISDAARFQSKVERLNQLHKLAVTGMGSSDKESENIAKSIPMAGERFETFSKKLSDYGNQIKNTKVRYLDRLGRAGRDITDFRDLMSQQPANKQTTPQQSDVVVKVLKDGSRVKVMKNAAGQWVEVL